MAGESEIPRCHRDKIDADTTGLDYGYYRPYYFIESPQLIPCAQVIY